MSDQGWDVVKLGALAYLEMGQAPLSQYISDRQTNGSWPFLQGNADFKAAYPVARQWCSKPAKLAKPGDSLISVRAPVGALNLADQAYCIGRGLAAVRFFRLHPGFGRHQLALKKGALHRVSQGSTFEAVGSKELRELQFLVPSDPEQRRIAEILDTLDRQIRATEQLIAKLALARKGLLNDLLTRGVHENGQLRDPISHPEHFKVTQAGLLPRAWTLASVGDTFDVKAGITLGPHRRPSATHLFTCVSPTSSGLLLSYRMWHAFKHLWRNAKVTRY